MPDGYFRWKWLRDIGICLAPFVFVATVSGQMFVPLSSEGNVLAPGQHQDSATEPKDPHHPALHYTWPDEKIFKDLPALPNDPQSPPPVPVLPEKKVRPPSSQIFHFSRFYGGFPGFFFPTKQPFHIYPPAPEWVKAVEAANNLHQKTLEFHRPETGTRSSVVPRVASQPLVSDLLAQSPQAAFIVTPVLPVFIRTEDWFWLPLKIGNQTNQPLEVTVAIRSGQAYLNTTLVGSSFYTEPDSQTTVTLPANDWVEVKFLAASHPGARQVVFQVVAVAGEHRQASQFSIPVIPRQFVQNAILYGLLQDRGVAIACSTSSQLEITTAGTHLQALEDGLLSLFKVPYESTEVISSRILGIAVLRDRLASFQSTELPTRSDLESNVEGDLKRLWARQHPDGSFSLWEKGGKSIPFVSVHAAHALARAQGKGFSVPKAMLERSSRYLRNIEAYLPKFSHPDVVQSVCAYALYVRWVMGDADVVKARKLITQTPGASLSAETIGWLLPILAVDPATRSDVDGLIQQLQQRMSTSRYDQVLFTMPWHEQQDLLLATDRRTDAIVLEGLLAARPMNDLVHKLITRMLASHRSVQWLNTQESVFSLLALNHSFQLAEPLPLPNCVGRVWYGDKFFGEHHFQGNPSESSSVMISSESKELLGSGNGVILAKEGPGQLAFRLKWTRFNSDFVQNEENAGISVTRSFEALDHPDDVKFEHHDWIIRAGARIRVNVIFTAPTSRDHVVVTSPVLTGMELLNPTPVSFERFQIEETASGAKANPASHHPVIDHHELESDQATAFISKLPGGVYIYSFSARAVLAGTYNFPPAKVKELYGSQRFGTTENNFVRVQ